MNGNSSQPCPQYGKAFRWALNRLKGNSTAKDVYVTITSCCNPADAIHPNARQLAKEAGMSLTRWSYGWADCRDARVLAAKEVRDQRGHRVGYHYIQATVEQPIEEPESPDPAGAIWEKSPDPAGAIWEKSPDPPSKIWEESPDPPSKIWEESPDPPSQIWETSPDPPSQICSLIQIRRKEDPPLPPLKRGGGPEIPQPRITRADRQRADMVMNHLFGRCRHGTPCRSPAECRLKLAAEFALARVEQERVIQGGTARVAMGQ